MRELAEAAVAYVERGWAIFPVVPRGKVPHRFAPHGFKDATTVMGVVQAWWRAVPDLNIGLATGHGFDVLDVDGPDGMAALDAACADRESVDGPTCRTGGGGHHVYVAPTGIGNKAGLLAKVDWRGLGGYVVAPPSVHASGRTYEWLGGWSPADVSPAPVPAWLLALIKPANPAMRSEYGPPPDINSRRQGPEAGAYGRRALEAEIAAVALAPDGSRNHQLNQSAFAIGQLIAGGEIPDGAGAIEMLYTAGIRSGLTDSECRATLQSGIRSGSAQPRTAPVRRSA
jgi:hypothetical protein